jgi:hypothetical protein
MVNNRVLLPMYGDELQFSPIIFQIQHNIEARWSVGYGAELNTERCGIESNSRIQRPNRNNREQGVNLLEPRSAKLFIPPGID